MSLRATMGRALKVLPGPISASLLMAMAPLLRFISPVHRDRSQTIKKIGHHHTVAGGTFAGMSYLPLAYGSLLMPKLIGSYELELAPAFDEILKLRPGTLIDIGTAEGYYAVGLARLLPDLRVIGYEMDGIATSLLWKLARKNGVANRIEMRAEASPAALRQFQPSATTLIICDVDGYEKTLLDPTAVPWLANVYLLVETHDCFVPGITAELRKRFAETHEIVEIPETVRTATSVRKAVGSAVDGLDDESLVRASNEGRPALQAWLWMKPHSPAGSGKGAPA